MSKYMIYELINTHFNRRKSVPLAMVVYRYTNDLKIHDLCI